MAHRDGARDRADRVRHRARHHHIRRQIRARPRSAREGPRAVIGELATLLNNLKPAPELALPCPMPGRDPHAEIHAREQERPRRRGVSVRLRH